MTKSMKNPKFWPIYLILSFILSGFTIYLISFSVTNNDLSFLNGCLVSVNIATILYFIYLVFDSANELFFSDNIVVEIKK